MVDSLISGAWLQKGLMLMVWYVVAWLGDTWDFVIVATVYLPAEVCQRLLSLAPETNAGLSSFSSQLIISCVDRWSDVRIVT